MRKLDIIGQTFHDLQIISENFNFPDKRSRFYNCLCLRCNRQDEVIIRQGDIINGKTKSCGCLRAEGPRRIYNPSKSTALAVFRQEYNDGDITFDQFMTLSQQYCFYCDAEVSNEANRFKYSKTAAIKSLTEGDFLYNGLDRIDSSKPHNIDNVVPCCWNCNLAKSAMSVQDFASFLATIHNFQQERIAK